ncbi:MAG: response regulator [Candidatus Omnitrophica bacterium]|nr:response regulator [Candidatus Omnitrophota bacterium]
MKKILIVEDEPDLLKVLSQHLENYHYQVLEAGDGEQGLKQVAEGKPDLIILDIKMPKIDGYTFVQELQSQKEYAKIPVIMLTANENLDSLFKVAGVSDYFTKPYQIEKIVAAIEKALST